MGGNVFENCNSIRREHIMPTMMNFADEMSRLFPAKEYSFYNIIGIGSVGKKDISGDIDLAYDEKFLFSSNEDKPLDFKGWNVSEDECEELYLKIKKRARTATPEQCKVRAMIELIGDYITENSDSILVDKKGSTSHALFLSTPQWSGYKREDELDQNVQIDLNIGDIDWLKFSYYSEVYAGNVKGLHRTQLMLSLFTEKGMMFKHSEGVLDKKTREMKASTPKEALDLLNELYNPELELTMDILNNYFKLHSWIINFVEESIANNIFDRLLRILESTRADVPEHLYEYWKDNKERLGLTGKFLPKDSKLLKS